MTGPVGRECFDPTGELRATVEFRPAHPADLPAIVGVHAQAFAGFFLTRLGPRFLERYYRLVLEQPGGMLWVAVHRGQAVGFVAGFASPPRFYAALKRRRISFALAVLPALLRSPGLLRRLWLDFHDVRDHAQPVAVPGPGAAELSSLGVADGWSGQGIGSGLLKAFVLQARELSVSSISLTTDADGNEAVNGFYRQAGFRPVRTFTQGDGRRMNEYLLEISSPLSGGGLP